MAASQSDSESSMVIQSSLHLNNAWQSFNECRHNGIFCDVVIKVEEAWMQFDCQLCGDNSKIFTKHKILGGDELGKASFQKYVTAARRSLFLGKWKSSEKQEVEIPGISPIIMASLLNFAYTGQVTVTSSNVEELLPAADQFLITYVKDKCCSFLKKQLIPTNCIGIRQYAKSYYCARLVDASTTYILRYFEEVSRLSDEFLSLKFDDMEQLISDDRLNVQVEECVCEAIFRWVFHDKIERIKYFTPLLKCVRLGLLDPEYFMTKVKGSELAAECMLECRSLIKEAMKVVCDLHSHDEGFIATQDHLFNTLLRPRLPFEILLAIGGWSGGSPTNAIEAYDPRAETWLNASTLPDSEATGQYRTVADIPRAYHGVAYVKGYIYVIGGFDGVNYFNTVRRMNVSTFDWIQEPSMLHKRCYISIAVLEGRIYALGGMNGEKRLNSGECYDPSQKTWSDLPDMNERRSDASATSLNTKVYIAGGFNGQECLFTAEFYDPESMTWTRITPMRSRRSGVSIISFHGLIYAVGGFDGINRLRHAEAYSPLTNSWKNTTSMATSRSNFGIEVIDDKLLVVGGYNGQRTSADVEAYDDTTNEWYPVKDMHICRSALSCCVITGLPHDILKKYCVPRDVPTSLTDDIDGGDETAFSERSDEVTSDDEDLGNYIAQAPPNGYIMVDNDVGNRDVLERS